MVKQALKRVVTQALLSHVWLDAPSTDEALWSLLERLRPRASARPLRRIGGAADGGYLLPEDLDGIVGCVSPGVSSEVGFDLAVAELGIPVFLADASVPGPPVNHQRFHFVRKHIGVAPSDTCMSLNELYAIALGSVPGKGDLILQMDIEGAEYAALLDLTDEHLARTRIIVAEFHDLHHLFSRFGFRAIAPVFEKLLHRHTVVHAHPNNAAGVLRRGRLEIPQLIELTLLRRDRGFCDEPGHLTFPHPLDRDNVRANPHIALPDCWYRNARALDPLLAPQPHRRRVK